MSEAVKLEPVPEEWKSALAIVAHPDDLEYGTASAIARWTSEGKSITYVMVSSGEAGIDTMAPAETKVIREREERASAGVVGVDQVEFLGIYRSDATGSSPISFQPISGHGQWLDRITQTGGRQWQDL